MRRLTPPAVGLLFMSVCLAFVTVSAHSGSEARHLEGWFKKGMNGRLSSVPALQAQVQALGTDDDGNRNDGQRLFERETFGGNGRTCLTCHSRETGTVSPEDARDGFARIRDDPLFVHDGSDDEDGDGSETDVIHANARDATILMRIPLHPNVTLKDAPNERFVTVSRGIPTTLNTPALDPVLMLDGRQPTLEDQALGAIRDHAAEHRLISQEAAGTHRMFQQTDRFFSSPALEFSRVEALPRAAAGQYGVGTARAALLRGSSSGFSVTLPTSSSASAPRATAGRCSTRPTSSCLWLFRRARVSRPSSCPSSMPRAIRSIDFIFSNQANDRSGRRLRMASSR